MEIVDDVDDAPWYFDTFHKQILDQHAPTKSIFIRPNQPPFMNSSLIKESGTQESSNYKIGFGTFLTIKL